MRNEQQKSKLAAWLDSIQQESWQLELIISGVVLFLLLGANTVLEETSIDINKGLLTGKTPLIILATIFVVIRLAYYALLLVFILHLLLRGLWIGAVGLRSVSGDFDYEVLNYQPRFTNWLKSRMGSFDDYIERLEMQCSVAFSFAFLIFFSVVSVGVYSLMIAGVTFGTASLLGVANGNDITPSGWRYGLVIFMNLFMVLIGLIYLIDFSTLGWFKRRKWTRWWYFPIYRLLGIVTLARIYRPFYYNLIDHPFGRKLVKRLWLIVIAGMVLASISVVRYDYFPNDDSGKQSLTSGVYLDRVVGKDNFNVKRPSLASRYADRDYLEVFIPYLAASNDRVIKHLYPEMTSAHSTTFAIDGPVNLWKSDNPEVDPDSLLLAHRSIHRLYLNDSLLTDVNWRFYDHPLREQPGLSYDLPVYDLPRGEHELRFENYILNAADSLYWKPKATITFLR